MLIYSTPGITIVFLRLQPDLEGRKLGAATLASITVCIYIYVHLYVKCNEDASRGRNRNVSTIGQWKFAKDTDGIDGIETNER